MFQAYESLDPCGERVRYAVGVEVDYVGQEGKGHLSRDISKLSKAAELVVDAPSGIVSIPMPTFPPAD